MTDDDAKADWPPAAEHIEELKAANKGRGMSVALDLNK